MLPTGTIHIDTFLTGALVGKTNEEYIADRILKPLYSPKLTGKIAKFGNEQYRVDFANRALGTQGQMVNWSVDSTTYDVLEYRLEHPVDDAEKGMYDDPYDAYRDAQTVLWNKCMLKKELLVASIVNLNTSYDSTLRDANNKSWDSTGNPITDITGAISTIVSKSGVSPTNLYGVCSYAVFNWLRTNAKVAANYVNSVPGAANPANITAPVVASCVGLAGLHVGTAVYNTANEGQTASYSWVWGGDDFMIVYIPPGDLTPMTPCFGATVYPRIEGLPGAQVVTDVYRNEALTSDVVRCRLMMDEIVTDSFMGYHFASVDGS